MRLSDKAEPALRAIAWFYLIVMLPLCVFVRLISQLPVERRDLLDWHIILCAFIVLLGINNGLYKKRPF